MITIEEMFIEKIKSSKDGDNIALLHKGRLIKLAVSIEKPDTRGSEYTMCWIDEADTYGDSK